MMMIREVRSPRIAQIALAALICAVLAACNDSGSSSAASAGVSTSPTSATGAASVANPSDKAVTLSWSRPTHNSDGSSLSNLAGYTLHYGSNSEDYTGSIEITNPTATSYIVNNGSFPPGTYYFAISAYNAQQVSSSLSGEISVTID